MDSNKLDPTDTVQLTFLVSYTYTVSKTVAEWERWFAEANDYDADLPTLAMDNGYQPDQGDEADSYVYALARAVAGTTSGDEAFATLGSQSGAEDMTVDVEEAQLG